MFGTPLVGFWFSWKAMLLAGLEAAFIVIALGARGPDALTAATPRLGGRFRNYDGGRACSPEAAYLRPKAV
jgi:hypothetical protein